MGPAARGAGAPTLPLEFVSVHRAFRDGVLQRRVRLGAHLVPFLAPYFVPRLGALMSLYDRLGGEPALAAAVTGLYRRLTSDPRVARFFEHLDLAELMQKQQAFLAFATGGAESYGGGELRAAHAPLIRRGLSDDHFDATLEHLAATLDDLGVPVAEQREAAARVESVRDEILGR